MRARTTIPRSRAAEWARLIGALAVPVLVLAAVGVRIGFVPGSTLIPVLVLGFALGLIAIGLAGYALTDIWNSGGEGAAAAIAGVIYGLPALLLLGGVSAAALMYPRLTDVATDPVDPPDFIDPAPIQPEPPDEDAEAERIALQAASYADIAPRSYPLPIAAVYAAAKTLMEERGWQVSEDIAPLTAASTGGSGGGAPAVEDPAVLKIISAKGEATQSRSEVVPAAPKPNAPAPPTAEGATIQAVARTPLFGFSDHVVLRMRAEGNGTRLDMRSASGVGMHDLGQNARRIRSFLAALDTALQPAIDAPPPPPAPAEPAPAPPGEKAQPATQ